MATEPTRRRFTVADYNRMAETGILGEDDRVELLDGEIVEMTPEGPSHSGVGSHLMSIFVLRLGDRANVRAANPVILDDLSEPEPDISVCAPRTDHYKAAHPRPGDILLVVEVSDTSLAYDRGRKARRYAAAGVPELWIVDLQHDVIEVFREPSLDGYAQSEVYRSGGVVSPAAFPDVQITVDELLA
jgi:Uma2 family endonuclease